MAMQYPTLPASPTRAHHARLLWRAGFSGTKAQIDHYIARGLAGAITELLNPFATSVLVGPDPHVGPRKLDPLNEWGDDALWWLDRMVRSRNQLVERMTLNLQDLFATSNAGVGNTRHMLPEPAAAHLRARQLRHAPPGDHARPGHAAVAERRRFEQVGAERELRPR